MNAAVVMEDLVAFEKLSGCLACGGVDDRVLQAIGGVTAFLGHTHAETWQPRDGMQASSLR